jgi:hypothetical protein
VVAKESTLYEMLVEDLSEVKASRFLKGYGERSAIIYNEAETAAKDEAIYKDFEPYYRGQMLFFLHQTMFVRLAADCKLDWKIVHCKQNNFPIPVVKIGRFHFTDHHGTAFNEIACLNPSMIRSQNSLVNLSLIQRSLFDPPFDPNKLRKADDIYGNFIHGCRGGGSAFAAYGFMRIAFPCVADVKNAEDAQKRLRYVESYDLYRLLDSVLTRENQNRSVVQPSVRVAPKIKKQQ